MEAILLKSKNRLNENKEFVIFDEAIKGVLTNELLIPAFTGAENGFRVISLTYLIDNYLFPIKDKETDVRIINFLKGYNKELWEKVEFYEKDELEIDNVPLFRPNK